MDMYSSLMLLKMWTRGICKCSGVILLKFLYLAVIDSSFSSE